MNRAGQFDAHRTPLRSTAWLFVIVPQPDDFSLMPTWVVAPSVPADAMPRLGSEHAQVAARNQESYQAVHVSGFLPAGIGHRPGPLI